MSFLEMSIFGGIFILAIAAIRHAVIQKLPKETFSLLWKIALFRLLVPITIASVFCIYPLLRRADPFPSTAAEDAGAEALRLPESPAPAKTSDEPADSGQNYGQNSRKQTISPQMISPAENDLPSEGPVSPVLIHKTTWKMIWGIKGCPFPALTPPFSHGPTRIISGWNGQARIFPEKSILFLCLRKSVSFWN